MVSKLNSKPPSARVARKQEQARNEILDAARKLLHERGSDAVTLASVAGELGMTKQALYHYFSSKEVLTRSLVTTLLDEEVNTLIAAVDSEKETGKILGRMILTFHEHYADRLDAFRFVYAHSQLYTGATTGLDADTLRDEINPRTRHLFDVLEERLAGSGASKKERRQARQLAFTAWTSALGLLTMLSVADAANDPLVHRDKALLDTLVGLFE
jgi:AcrR family transcriptional regulator